MDKNTKLILAAKKLTEVANEISEVQHEIAETYGEKFDRLIEELSRLDKKISAKISKIAFGREEAMIKYKLYSLLRIFADQNYKENIVRILDDCYRKLGYASVFNTANLLSNLSSKLDEVLDGLGSFVNQTRFVFESDLGKGTLRPLISLSCRRNEITLLGITLYKEGIVNIDYPSHLYTNIKSGISGVISPLAWQGKNGLEIEENTTKLGEIVPDIFSSFRYVSDSYYKKDEVEQD